MSIINFDFENERANFQAQQMVFLVGTNINQAMATAPMLHLRPSELLPSLHKMERWQTFLNLQVSFINHAGRGRPLPVKPHLLTHLLARWKALSEPKRWRASFRVPGRIFIPIKFIPWRYTLFRDETGLLAASVARFDNFSLGRYVKPAMESKSHASG